MFQVGPDADLMNKLSCSLPDPEEEASDEVQSFHIISQEVEVSHSLSLLQAKGDSRASPMYPRTKQSGKPKKQVSFHTTAFVVLIPTVKEYHDAGLGDLLWWNECDFHQFKLSAAKDVKEFMKTVPTLEPKKALKLYFQTFMDDLAPSTQAQAAPIPQAKLSLSQPETDPATETEGDCEEEGEEEEVHGGESELPPIVSQRHDSITSSKYSREHNHFSQHCGDSSSEDSEGRKSLSHYESGDAFGVSMDSISMFGKMLAVGLLVFMNRSHSSN